MEKKEEKVGENIPYLAIPSLPPDWRVPRKEKTEKKIGESIGKINRNKGK